MLITFTHCLRANPITVLDPLGPPSLIPCLPLGMVQGPTMGPCQPQSHADLGPCPSPVPTHAQFPWRSTLLHLPLLPALSLPDGPEATCPTWPPAGLQVLPTGTLPRPQDAGGVSGQLAHQQAYPQLVEGSSGKTESRVTKKPHVATPVLIPKGAVLRVFICFTKLVSKGQRPTPL